MSSLNGDLGALLWQTVYVRRVSSGAVDRYNVPADTLAAPEPLSAYVEVTGSTESAGTARERSQEALLVTWPEAGLRARDIVEVDGQPWLVAGEPRTFAALEGGAAHHLEATLTRISEGP